jgi:hypothetical protein
VAGSAYRSDDEFVFCHPQKGTPLDPSKLSKEYLRPGAQAGRDHEAVPPFRDLRPPP